MSLKFCPKCSNLLIYINDPSITDGLVMRCQSCNYTVTDDNTCIYVNKFVQNAYDIKIDANQCYDTALPYTENIYCLNTECPSNGFDLFLKSNENEHLSKKWNSMTDEERNKWRIKSDITPRIKYFHYNKDMKLAYICCICQTYWKN